MDLDGCVFHLRTAQNLDAQVLLPLSRLRESHPDVFWHAMAKYDDTPERRRLPETWIPLLEARWMDAVFLSPVHPHAIWSAWREITGAELPSQEFWAIPIEDVAEPVVLDRRHSRTGDAVDPRDVRRCDRQRHRARFVTTEPNRKWLAHLAGIGARGAWFSGIPHVLTTHPVSLARARVIDWSSPWPDGETGQAVA